MVTFRGARFQKQCLFSDARFESGLNFARAQVGGMLSFSGASFAKELSLQDSQVNTVAFDDAADGDERLPDVVRLDGLTYSRFIGQWKSLFARIREDPTARTHLQPYAHLEKYFRSNGYERDADEVFLERRKLEWRLLKGRVLVRKLGRSRSWWSALGRFIEDSALWGVFNYGVPSYRLIVVAVVVLLLGSAVLTFPGALELKGVSAAPGDACTETDPERSTFVDRAPSGFGTFLSSVMPGEHSKDMSRWTPSSRCVFWLQRTYKQWAVFLGWVIYACVTVALASLVGLVRRKQT